MSNDLRDVLASHAATEYYTLRDGGHEFVCVQTLAGGLYTVYRRCEAGYAFERQVGRLPVGARIGKSERRIKWRNDETSSGETGSVG